MFGLRPWDADPDNPGCLSWGEVFAYQRALQHHADVTRVAEAE